MNHRMCSSCFYRIMVWLTRVENSRELSWLANPTIFVKFIFSVGLYTQKNTTSSQYREQYIINTLIRPWGDLENHSGEGRIIQFLLSSVTTWMEHSLSQTTLAFTSGNAITVRLYVNPTCGISLCLIYKATLQRFFRAMLLKTIKLKQKNCFFPDY
jgi:hypothetical protein